MRFRCYLYAVLIKTTSYLVDESSLNFIIKRLQNVCKAILSTVYLQRDNMSLHGELREVIFGDNQERKMVWMQQRGLLARQKTVSVRDGSFFEKSKLPISKLLHCIYLWALETSVISATAQLAVSARTLVDFYNFLREVCSAALIRNPVQLGGPGRIVQIDESLFAHKPKYHRGRAPRNEIWVFGMADCTSNPALGFMQIVERRNAETLLPIIQRHILPGSIVYSDQWAAYNRVGNIAGIEHHTVNHSLHFVDPVTGVHTQNIESY